MVGVLGTGIVEPDAAVLRADDLGLTRGDGCFDATRVVTAADGSHRIDHLPDHLDRFATSAAGLDLPPVDRNGWTALIEQVLARWTRPGEALLRLMLTRGQESGSPVTGVLTLAPITDETLRQRREGIDVVMLNRGTTIGAFENSPWLLGGVKTLSYGVNVAAGREARRRGAHDVIFTSAEGYLLEAPTATVVRLDGNTLTTTPLDGTGVLASITQRSLFAAAERAGYRTGYALATVADLLAGDGAWLVSSGRGVAAINSVDGTAVKTDPERTTQLRALAGF